MDARLARTKKGTSLLIKIILTVLVIYLLYIFITLQVKINTKKNEIAGLDTQISVLTAEQQELTDILDAEVDKEYVEKVARDLGYVNADEKVYESITD